MPKSSISTITVEDRKRIDRLILRLMAIYGHVWKSLYKCESFLEISKEEWLLGLQRFNNDTVKEALMNYIEQLSHPPTLPQFINKCKALENRGGAFFTKDVSTKTACTETAKLNLKKMREILLKP